MNQKRVKNRYLFIMVESSRRSKTGDAAAGVVVSITCLPSTRRCTTELEYSTTSTETRTESINYFSGALSMGQQL